MRQLRTLLLFAAGLLMGFAALVYATVSVPHLREDMVEINVRPTLLGAVSLGLHFGTFAMFAFAGLALVAAVQSLRKAVVARPPLWIIAVLYIGFGVFAFVRTGSHHTLGYVFIGILVVGGAVIPEPR
jgi:hypothetical protein